MAEGEDRTQAPSERRLARAREEGQAPLSRELVTACGLGAAVAVLALGGPGMVAAFAVELRAMLTGPGGVDEGVRRAGVVLLQTVLPFLIAVALAASSATMVQTGFLLHASAPLPDLARLDPRRGLKRLFGPYNATEAVKALAKLAVLSWAVWVTVSGLLPILPGASAWEAGLLLRRIGAALVHLLLLALALQIGIAALDVAWTRWRYGQRLRMSREDLRQEQRESEGDPKVKARLRQLRLLRARRRMLAAVAKATVVVTNPTHFAVALAYERGSSGAPRIVAKGVDDVAARIRTAAEKAGVPLVANPPLARSLYATALDSEVPAEHFRMVAEIIAYVWRLQARRA